MPDLEITTNTYKKIQARNPQNEAKTSTRKQRDYSSKYEQRETRSVAYQGILELGFVEFEALRREDEGSEGEKKRNIWALIFGESKEKNKPNNSSTGV